MEEEAAAARDTQSPVEDIIGSGLGEEDEDIDEEEFKRALENAKKAAEKLSQRPISKK